MLNLQALLPRPQRGKEPRIASSPPIWTPGNIWDSSDQRLDSGERLGENDAIDMADLESWRSLRTCRVLKWTTNGEQRKEKRMIRV